MCVSEIRITLTWKCKCVRVKPSKGICALEAHLSRQLMSCIQAFTPACGPWRAPGRGSRKESCTRLFRRAVLASMCVLGCCKWVQWWVGSRLSPPIVRTHTHCFRNSSGRLYVFCSSRAVGNRQEFGRIFSRNILRHCLLTEGRGRFAWGRATLLVA